MHSTFVPLLTGERSNNLAVCPLLWGPPSLLKLIVSQLNDKAFDKAFCAVITAGACPLL